MATLRLLEIVRDQPQVVKVYHASTSEIYGQAKESPQTEETPFFPTSPYGMRQSVRDSTGQSLPAIVWDVRL